MKWNICFFHVEQIEESVALAVPSSGVFVAYRMGIPGHRSSRFYGKDWLSSVALRCAEAVDVQVLRAGLSRLLSIFCRVPLIAPQQ